MQLPLAPLIKEHLQDFIMAAKVANEPIASQAKEDISDVISRFEELYEEHPCNAFFLHEGIFQSYGWLCGCAAALDLTLIELLEAGEHEAGH